MLTGTSFVLIALAVSASMVFLRLLWLMFSRKQPQNYLSMPEIPDPVRAYNHSISMIEVTNTNMRLKGKTALITGAGSGIGRAMAIAFAREGAKVALVGRRSEPLQQVAKEIGPEALVLSADVTKPEDIERIVRETVAKFGSLNVLVNNAAYLVGGTTESHTDDEFLTTLDTNVTALWRLCRAVIPHMRQSGGGSIINLSSVVGLVGARNRVAYSTSKGAVTLMTKAMALDHAHENIRVNCICPGVVETELVAGFIKNAPDPELARKQRIALHPMGRFGQPNDISGLAIYLASDESSWMTGSAIPIDGGYTAI